jgi:hypothetical protein
MELAFLVAALNGGKWIGFHVFRSLRAAEWGYTFPLSSV